MNKTVTGVLYQKIRLSFSILWLAFSATCFAENNDKHYIEPIPHLVMGVFLPAISNEVNLSDIKISLDFWIKELSEQMNVLDSHVELYTDIQLMKHAFENQQLDMIVAPPIDFLRYFDLSLFESGFLGVTNTERLNALTLLVKDKSIQHLSDLRGKTLALPQDDELCQLFIDVLTLRHSNMDAQHYFSSVSYKKKSSRLILDLFFDQFDAVVIYHNYYELMVELNPQIHHKLAILDSYPLKAKNFAFFHKNYPYRKRVQQRLYDFSNNRRAKQILELFKSNHLIKSELSDLKPIDTLYQEYLQLQKIAP